MPTRVFFNEPPEPFVILNYAENLSSVCISVSHEDHADPVAPDLFHLLLMITTSYQIKTEM
ncbi:MAG: hypothetical protein EOM23_11315 [Candidatus Moranbacteria bacterium]|nr:hypothetical protein [Candidatus Moranbacteria bacterium]